MNDLDKMIKKQAQGEPIITPVGYSERIDRLTANLPEKVIPRTRKTALRISLIAAVFLILSAVSVFGTPYVAKMASGVINYYNAPHQFKNLSNQVVYEKYNSEVGISTTDQGITLTVDNIAMDDNFILVFYTVKSETPIQLAGDDDDLKQWRINWTAPHFWFKENGRYIDPAAQGNVEAYLPDAYTLKGMQRFTVIDTLEDIVNLEIYSEEIFNKQGQWHIPLSVDKSSVAVESLTVNPKTRAVVTTGWNRQFSHKVTVEKVSISPFGSQIVLSERGENNFTQFALRDDQGRYLTVIPSATYSSILFKATNSFEFIGGSTDLKELTIIPIVSGDDTDNLPAPELVKVDLGNYPIQMPISELGGFIMERFEISKEKAVATFRQQGAVQIMTPNLILFDENGQDIDFTAFVDQEYDQETGIITITHSFQNASDEDIARVKKAGYFKRPQRLNEDEAITIKLK